MAGDSLTREQIDFLQTFLNIQVAAAAGADMTDPDPDLANFTPENPADIWIDARSQVDAMMAGFRSRVAAFDDPNLKRIADFGLDGMTQGNNTALMGALVSYRLAGQADRAKAQKAVRQGISEYRKFLSSNALIALCDNNPFGPNLNVSGTLIGALDKMDRAIAA